jgi:phosphoribosylaminoimidazole-succinocarboxamide synthase
MKTAIPRKGEILCKFAEFWFDSLGTRHHMLNIEGKDKMIAKSVDIIPIECVVRGYFYGSLLERYKNSTGNGDKGDNNNTKNDTKKWGDSLLPSNFQRTIAAKLPNPIFDPTTKSEEHDIPITENEAISSGIVSKSEFDYLKQTSVDLYKKMSSIVQKAGFIIADVKFEFGKDPTTQEILLADSLGPDEYRLWLQTEYIPGKIQESYDKQLLRDWLIKTGFKKKIDVLQKQGAKPDSPELPPELVSELTRRYIYAYEKITGKRA